MPPKKSANKKKKSLKSRLFNRYLLRKRPGAGFISGTHRIPGEIHEISQSGMLFLTRKTLEVGSVGKVGAQMPNWFFRANAVVRTVVAGKAFGLEFLNMSSLDRQMLRNYCGRLDKATQDSRGKPSSESSNSSAIRVMEKSES